MSAPPAELNKLLSPHNYYNDLLAEKSLASIQGGWLEDRRTIMYPEDHRRETVIATGKQTRNLVLARFPPSNCGGQSASLDCARLEARSFARSFVHAYFQVQGHVQSLPRCDLGIWALSSMSVIGLKERWIGLSLLRLQILRSWAL